MNKQLRPLVAALALGLAGSAWASATGLVLSQVYGGGGNTGAVYTHDFVELRNAGASAVSLSGLSLQYASATGTGNFQANTLPAVTLQPGQYFLVQLATSGSNGSALPVAPDHVPASAPLNLSGSAGKIALVNSASALACNGGSTPCTAAQKALIVDLIGYGSANFYEGGAAAPTLSVTLAGLRGNGGCTDTDNNAADIGAGTPSPRNSATSYAICSGGGGGETPATIPQIQGTGPSSPMVGQRVRTSGVVTLRTNAGFFMQDPVGDSDPLSSDGIYVYLGTAPTVQAGDLVQLVGTVTEFNTGAASNADTAAHPLTELAGVSGLSVIGSGAVSPIVISLPEATNDDLEHYEGMLVTLTGPLTVSQNYFQGRYGQVTLSAGGRMETPTNRYRPNSAQALALAELNARSRIILDDGTSQQNPNPTPYIGADNTLRAGDTVASVTGVVDYGLATSSNTGFGDYRIQPTLAPVITRTNARPVAAPKVGGNLRVAAFNVLNYFTTFTNGRDAWDRTGQGCLQDGVSAPANCRGADNLAEFTRQRNKIIEALATLDADVVGLLEMQNNGSTALQNLVDGLNDRVGAGTYARVPDPASGTGSDAIKVAMIYKPGRLALAGSALSDTDAIHNRPPLAQAFEAPNGERFVAVVNHLKSKGSCPVVGDPDYTGNADGGDGQGCWNARRVAQAQRMLAWLPTLTGTSPRVLMLGDFNAYALEDPIHTLTTGGLVDQVARFETFGYSYVFDGAAGRLDHVLATPAASDLVTRALEWHVNADEPSVIDYNTEFKQPLCSTCGPDYYSATAYRSSDHDPVLLGLGLWKRVTGTSGRDVLVGSPGDDLLDGGGAADTLTGGGGTNVYLYRSVRDAGDTITDFVPGRDQIDLRDLLASVGWSGTDPVADGLVRVSADASGRAVIQVDADGPLGPAALRSLVTLNGVTPGQLVAGRDLVFRNTTALRKRAGARRIQ